MVEESKVTSAVDVHKRVLCVDDERNVLNGLERTLFEHFDVSTAESGAAGLELLQSEGSFAVVVSDMRMPGMDGAAFLKRVRESFPDSVRILLTGHADINAAISAVNDGNIFRFLYKPCPQDVLIKSLEDAAEQYRLVIAEKDLLEKTLHGSVKVLTDVLSLAAPVAFSRASLVKSYVTHMAEHLGVADKWKYELAAMLSQVGCITLPPDTLDKVYAGQSISKEEQEMLDAHPEIGHRLLASIPRFEAVAEMIRLQFDPAINGSASDEVKLGASMLCVALAFDKLLVQGMSVEAAVAKLGKSDKKYDSRVVEALGGFRGHERGHEIKALHIRELRTFMILDEDIRNRSGNVVVPKGTEVTGPLIERLKNFAQGVGIIEPIRVRIPQ